MFGVRFTAWTEEKAGIPVVSWRGDEDLLSHTASGAPLPVGSLEVRKILRAGGRRHGACDLARRAAAAGTGGDRPWLGLLLCDDSGAGLIRRWRPAAWCSTCWCSERWPRGRWRWEARGSF